MPGPISTCVNCGAKNRLAPASATSAVPQCGRCSTPLPWLLDANEQSFAAESNVPIPVLIDLWAPWCGPCRMVAPALEQLSNELAGRLKVLKVNVDENPQLAATYRASSIPLMVLLDGGVEKKRIIGAKPKAAIQQAIEPFLPAALD